MKGFPAWLSSPPRSNTKQALAVLEHSGISQKQMLVVSMDTEPKGPFELMSKTRDLHSKGVEVGIACATGFSVIGASVGFILEWGPIIWGLMASFIGFWFGFGLYFVFSKGVVRRRLPAKLPEITVIVQCLEEDSAHVREIMWKHKSLTVGRFPEPS